MALSRFQRWLFKELLLKIVVSRQEKWMFKELRETYVRVYHEDNFPTREDYLLRVFFSQETYSRGEHIFARSTTRALLKDILQ